jgi:hypothetical protein
VPHALRLDGDALVCEPHPAVAAARSAALGEATDGRSVAAPSSAVDVVWEPGERSALRVAAAQGAATGAAGGGGAAVPGSDGGAAVPGSGGEVVVLEAGHDVVVARAGGASWEMPRGVGAVRVLVDGATCEVFTNAGVLGLAVPAAEALVVAVVGDGRAQVHALA